MRASLAVRAILLMALIPFLTGCWNSRELKSLSIIGAIGIDKMPDSQLYRVSFQIINPSTVASAGGGTAANPTAMPITVYTGTGRTIFEAIRKTSKISPRQLFFSHIRLLVIGESLAREGVSNLFDFFERSHEIRLTTKLLVARGVQAEKLLQVLTPLEKIPANAAYGKLESTKKLWSESLDVGVDDVINTLISPSKQLLISGARIVGRSEEGGKKSNLENAKLPAEIEIKGIALFKDGRLETWLDDDLARGTLWIRDELKTTVIPIPCKREEGIAAIEVTRSSTRVRASMEDGEPVFRVFVREEGNVNEVTCAVDLGKKEEILRYEDEWKAETERQIREAIRFAQSQSSDILGFGEVLNRSHPKTWKKLEDRWSSIFARCKTEVRAEAYIRRSGMRLKPYIKE
ncbi:hypothetical protein J19TS2_47710 [Cohnella xylanilytica]|uniref:Ger(X)C family spore germination protein n=1 Tax=Cohnella xylanilytica TaxID=557555 RepID=A0A841U1M5_9BACL|nr:Ger(x)C family spore germination protein [Cohnella xylanilytica]MBB6693679.1 Ger(x)C family spore germination protein [Cohnella xylanilytica]GIO15216.1 hypothetical protein J19TS2_47710 [Cohnella xylanilytica]